MKNLLLLVFLNLGMFAFGQNVASSFSSDKKFVKTVREYPNQKAKHLTNKANNGKSTYAYLTKITNSYTKEEYDNRKIKSSYTIVN